MEKVYTAKTYYILLCMMYDVRCTNVQMYNVFLKRVQLSLLLIIITFVFGIL